MGRYLTTLYQTELTGLELAIAKAKAEPRARCLNKCFWFRTDNQTVIHDLTELTKLKHGLAACTRIQSGLAKLFLDNPGSWVAIIWFLSKKDIKSMILVDQSAKDATTSRRVISTTPNPNTQMKIKEKIKATATARLPPTALHWLCGISNQEETNRALRRMPRRFMTFVTQILSGHFPLNTYLHLFSPLHLDLPKAFPYLPPLFYQLLEYPLSSNHPYQSPIPTTHHNTWPTWSCFLFPWCVLFLSFEVVYLFQGEGQL